MATFSIKQFNRKQRQRRKKLIEERPRLMLLVGTNLMTLVKLRVQTEGKDATGKDFDDYVEAYEKVRQGKGLQTAYVDFTDTGRMWASFAAEIIKNTATSTTVEVAPRDSFNRLKAEGQYKKRGNFVEPNQDEIDAVMELYKSEVLKIMQG